MSASTRRKRQEARQHDAVQVRAERQRSSQGHTVPAVTIFTILAICHTLAAIYAPIQDCDEVFNYWEPTHFLTHGEGLQTWEYAPRYAIRSWAYAGLHAAVIAVFKYAVPGLSKAALFYALRLVLGLVCAACETRLFTTISKTLNERVAVLCLIVTVTSPGLYHASVAYLPSSFAMYTAMLGAAAFMDWRAGLKTARGIFWFGLGASLGWPFAAALSTPFLLEELALAIISNLEAQKQLAKRLVQGVAVALVALAAQIAIDATYYKQLTIVPLNIVLYNVFSTRGPDLYGTEPWHFYLRNLALNFHVWLALALLAYPILLLQMLSDRSVKQRARALTFLAPLYLWLAIFTVQPHKEERFMYPAYPFLILNAAYTFNATLAAFGSPSSVTARIPVMLRLAVILAFVVSAVVLSALKVLGTWSAFGAPLSVYTPLTTSAGSGNVCLGKEWYRFPSHYLMPDGYHAKFVRSEFHGLLPGEFHARTVNGSIISATAVDPPGMNDENLEDEGKYVSLTACDFMIDSHVPSTVPTALEPSYLEDAQNWKRLKCLPFLDAASTSIVPRLFWTPDLPWLPSRLQRVYGEYCLLQRTKR